MMLQTLETSAKFWGFILQKDKVAIERKWLVMSMY